MAVAKIDADNAYQDRKAQNWARLVKSGGVTNPRESASEDPRGDVLMPNDCGYGRIRMESRDSVQIELRSLPVDLAIRVLNALKGAS